MSGNEQKFPYLAVFSDEIRHILRNFKRKNRALHSRLSKEIYKILNNPEIGKPLRYSLKSCRRIHVGSYVLVYEIMRESVFFLDFNHHDKIYKKWSDGFGLLGIIIVLAVIATLGTGGGLYYNEVRNQKSLVQIGLEKEKEAEQLKEKRQETGDKRQVTDDTIGISDWKTYRNEKYGFEVRYSSEYRVSERSEIDLVEFLIGGTFDVDKGIPYPVSFKFHTFFGSQSFDKFRPEVKGKEMLGKYIWEKFVVTDMVTWEYYVLRLEGIQVEAYRPAGEGDEAVFRKMIASINFFK